MDTTPNVGKDIVQLIHCWGKCKTIQLLWKKCLEVCYKTNYIPTLWSNNSTCRYLPKKNKCICLQKDLQKNLHGSFIHNRQKLLIGQLSLIKRRDKLWYIHILEYYSAIKRDNQQERISQTLCWVKGALHKKSPYCIIVQKVLKQAKLIYNGKKNNSGCFRDGMEEKLRLGMKEMSWVIIKIYCISWQRFGLPCTCQSSGNLHIKICIFNCV